MLRIQLMSDLHIEHHADLGEEFLASLHPVDVDVLVLAGDICQMTFKDLMRSSMAVFCRKYEHVILVNGNHEYYGGVSPQRTDLALEELTECFSNLTILRSGKVLTYRGQRFLGDTMWFQDSPSLAKGGIRDFKAIPGLRPWVFERNAAFRSFIEKELQQGDVVVTHHLPSFRSVAPRWIGARTNPFFVSSQEDLIAERSPCLWIHGHTHDPADYLYSDRIRIVCNPLGYPHEGVIFDDNKIVSVGGGLCLTPEG